MCQARGLPVCTDPRGRLRQRPPSPLGEAHGAALRKSCRRGPNAGSLPPRNQQAAPRLTRFPLGKGRWGTGPRPAADSGRPDAPLPARQKRTPVAFGPTAAEPRRAVAAGCAEVCALGGSGGQGFLPGPEGEGGAECPRESDPGHQAQHLPLRHRRCGPAPGAGWGGVREGRGQVAVRPCAASGSGTPSSPQPAT